MRYVDYNNCGLYRVDPPDDEQKACSKHVEAYYWNKLIENSASGWFILYRHIMMHGQQNYKRKPSYGLQKQHFSYKYCQMAAVSCPSILC